MKKVLFLASCILLFVGCDPIYHIYYVVANNSSDTLVLMSPRQGDSIISYTILPARKDTVFTESGVGYSKPIFAEQNEMVRKGITFYSGFPDNDSLQFLPGGKWIYSEVNRCEGTAILTITPSDLKK